MSTFFFIPFHETWRANKILNLSATGHKPADIKQTTHKFEFDVDRRTRHTVILTPLPDKAASVRTPSRTASALSHCTCSILLGPQWPPCSPWTQGRRHLRAFCPWVSGLNPPLLQFLANIFPGQWPPYLKLQTGSPELITHPTPPLLTFSPKYLPLSNTHLEHSNTWWMINKISIFLLYTIPWD